MNAYDPTKHLGMFAPVPDDALARLEEWLREDENHVAEFTCEDSILGIELMPRPEDGTMIRAFERHEPPGEPMVNTAFAKEPGLGPTIHAALDKAEERKL